jgi:hypothetical protein
VSFNRAPSVPLLGNGISNLNCYVAPGVNALSCYYYNGAACVLTQDFGICSGGGSRLEHQLQPRWLMRQPQTCQSC